MINVKRVILPLLLCWLAVLPAWAQQQEGLAEKLLAPAGLQTDAPVVSSSIAMHGQTKYGADFTHFDYVNPDAPKGGTMHLSGPETFDNLNQFITKGISAKGLKLIYQTLLTKSEDEPFSMYGALAETIEVPKDRSWIIFNLRPEAKWHDGKPVTADDVVWTFNTIMAKGLPQYKAYYASVEKVEALDKRRVKFIFNQAGNLELPLIVGELAILPKHYWAGRDFEATTLDKPLGSGPYKVGKVNPGRSIEYVRVKNWWADNLPVYKGRFNFDRIVFDYYRDQNITLEAFFAGEFDFHQEYTAKLWATAYDAPPVVDGRIKKQTVKNEIPQGMQAFVMNLRRPVFQDIAVRKAIAYAFDFEWSNKQFAYGAYDRTRSFFQNSEMAATGLPEGRELEILEQFRDRLPEAVFTEEYNPPKTKGYGNNRENLKAAIKLLEEAGYQIGKDGLRVDPKTGAPLEFEFVVANTNAAFERWFGPWKKNMQRIGIKANIRVVDAAQYINMILAFDYDMIVSSWPQSTSPGNEQREYWGSDRADMSGSRNFIGLKDPVVDELIELIVTAPSREELVIRCRALDRILQAGWYVVPNWHLAAWRIAYWNKFEKPKTQAPYDLGYIDTWWAK